MFNDQACLNLTAFKYNAQGLRETQTIKQEIDSETWNIILALIASDQTAAAVLTTKDWVWKNVMNKFIPNEQVSFQLTYNLSEGEPSDQVITMEYLPVLVGTTYTIMLSATPPL
jgi:hypothetical protein